MGGFYLFHVVTFLALSIIFLPHCVALLALLPLERLVRVPQVQPVPVREPLPA